LKNENEEENSAKEKNNFHSISQNVLTNLRYITPMASEISENSETLEFEENSFLPFPSELTEFAIRFHQSIDLSPTKGQKQKGKNSEKNSEKITEKETSIFQRNSKILTAKIYKGKNKGKEEIKSAKSSEENSESKGKLDENSDENFDYFSLPVYQSQNLSNYHSVLVALSQTKSGKKLFHESDVFLLYPNDRVTFYITYKKPLSLFFSPNPLSFYYANLLEKNKAILNKNGAFLDEKEKEFVDESLQVDSETRKRELERETAIDKLTSFQVWSLTIPSSFYPFYNVYWADEGFFLEKYKIKYSFFFSKISV
jgi:hypothetical protein